MTSKLEKQFFDTFGIDKRVEFEPCYALDSSTTYLTSIKRYPQITDCILLELICIVLNVFETFEVYRIMDIASLKDKILKLSMLAKDDVYSQVRTLFEEG